MSRKSNPGQGQREARAIAEIDCPACGARKGRPCKHQAAPGRVPCCGARRKANQERRRQLRASGDII